VDVWPVGPVSPSQLGSVVFEDVVDGLHWWCASAPEVLEPPRSARVGNDSAIMSKQAADIAADVEDSSGPVPKPVPK
jgi:hypothetical protein